MRDRLLTKHEKFTFSDSIFTWISYNILDDQYR